MKAFKLCVIVAIGLSISACAHLKSAYHASSKTNTCADIQRQIMFSSTADGNKTQWDVQSERMQLERTYQQENCYDIMKKDTSSSDSDSA